MSDNEIFRNIEILKEKFEISYKEAKEVLDLNNNDLISALMYFEQKYPSKKSCSVKAYLKCIKNHLGNLYEEGSNQRIVITRKGEVIADLPLTAVLISSFTFIIYPIILPLKIGGILLFDIGFKLVDKTGKVHDLKSSLKDKMNCALSISKNKLTKIMSKDDMKSTADEIRMKAKQFGRKAVEDFNEIIESTISKKVKEKIPAYAKFVYDAETDQVENQIVEKIKEQFIEQCEHCECEEKEDLNEKNEEICNLDEKSMENCEKEMYNVDENDKEKEN